MPTHTQFYSGNPVGSAGNTPAANATALLSAIAACPAGFTILLTSGATFAEISPAARTMASAIRIRSADLGNKAKLQTTSTGTSVARFVGWTGIYLCDLMIEALSYTAEFVPLVSFESCTDVGVFGCTITGTTVGDGDYLGRGINFNNTTIGRAIKNSFYNISYGGISYLGGAIEFIGNTVNGHSADGFQIKGVNGVKVYLNTFSPNFALGNHPDGIQITVGTGASQTPASTQDPIIWNNFVNCDTTKPIRDGGPGNRVSAGRCQGIFITDETGAKLVPTLRPIVADNQSWGTFYNGLTVSGADNLQFFGTNKVYHIEATPAPDDITFAQLSVADDTSGTYGTAIFDVHRVGTFGALMTNPFSQAVNPKPSAVKTNAERIAALAAWTPERDAYLALMGA